MEIVFSKYSIISSGKFVVFDTASGGYPVLTNNPITSGSGNGVWNSEKDAVLFLEAAKRLYPDARVVCISLYWSEL